MISFTTTLRIYTVEQAPLASLPVSFAASGILSSSLTPPLYNDT
ncbi:hypothetical protein NC652_001408 [Populus alba x Populus x berolinensis]|nr:hypothetical protein NC652_001408 [Populus alba x Populus x berolinensis]